MAKYIAQRIVAMLLTLFIIITIGFMVIRLMPGGIFDEAVDMTFEQKAALEAKYNLDKPIPIQYALYYPERRFLPGDRLDFGSMGQITFEPPDPENFRGLALAYEAGRRGGSLPVVFNAANEYAVSEFLNRRISYLEITDMIEEAMRAHQVIDAPDVEQILEAERQTRQLLAGISGKKAGR